MFAVYIARTTDWSNVHRRVESLYFSVFSTELVVIVTSNVNVNCIRQQKCCPFADECQDVSFSTGSNDTAKTFFAFEKSEKAK